MKKILSLLFALILLLCGCSGKDGKKAEVKNMCFRHQTPFLPK